MNRTLLFPLSAESRVSASSMLLKWLGVNAVFALCHPVFSPFFAFPALPRSLVVNAVLFVLPAVGWNLWKPSRSRALGMRLMRTMAISTAVFLASMAIVWLLDIGLTAASGWNTIWVLTNVGFGCALWAGRPVVSRRSLLPREVLLASVLFLFSYALYYWGATRVVPPEDDHDLEVQATGYGLLTRFEPLLLTDRGTVYYFAHPPLLHFYAAGSFLLNGALEDLRFYDDISLRARDRRRGLHAPPADGPAFLYDRPETFRIVADEGKHVRLRPEDGGEEIRVPTDEMENGRILRHYAENPHRLETRTPNLFFASLTVTLLALWVGRISRRWWLGLLVALAYAVSPEVFVRSSYGGYFAVGALAIMLMLLSVNRRRQHKGWAVLTSGFAALADHKLVFLPLAFGAEKAWEWLRRARPRRLLDGLSPTVVGFGIGTVIFWLFGLIVAPHAFFQDHIRNHLIDRVTQYNPLGYEGYATALGLWREFASHTGYLLLPVGMLMLLWDLYRSRRSPSPQDSVRRVWLVSILMMGVAFTVIDWRMTKHIAPIILLLHLALAPGRRAPTWRVAVPVVTLLFSLAYDSWILRALHHNFFSLKITPAW